MLDVFQETIRLLETRRRALALFDRGLDPGKVGHGYSFATMAP